MKKILCFGDSNTFGFNPKNGTRYNEKERWSGILKKELNNYEIIEDGMNNRTCFSNSSYDLNSFIAIKKYLDENYDLIIFQIGINDLQLQYNTSLQTFENKFIELVKNINPESKKIKTKILFLCPNKINECITKSYFNSLFDEISIDKSAQINKVFESISNKTGADIVFLENMTKTSAIDGLHYDIENHKIIADVLKKYILELFKQA